jgi:hypothetical protein
VIAALFAVAFAALPIRFIALEAHVEVLDGALVDSAARVGRAGGQLGLYPVTWRSGLPAAGLGIPTGPPSPT